MIAQITLVCDNPRHARGKVATLAVYIRVSGRWERRVLFRKSALRTRRNFAARRRQRMDDAQASGSTADIAAALAGDPRQGNPSCKLCRAALVGRPEPTDIELERFSVQGQAIVSIKELNKLRLTRKR